LAKEKRLVVTDDLDYGKLGFIDRSGKVVIMPRFDRAGDFALNGLAPVALFPPKKRASDPVDLLTQKWGYIDTKGHVVIPLQFLGAFEFGDNNLAAVVREDSSLDFIDSNGRFRTSLHFQLMLAGEGMHGAYLPVAFSHRLATAPWNWKWGYIDTSGHPVAPSRFEGARVFSASGLAAIKQGGKWGYVDITQKIVIPPRFEKAAEFALNGLASVSLGGKCGYVDRKGIVVVPPQFEQCFGFGQNAPGNLARIRPDYWRGEGLIDTKGKVVLRSVPVDASEPHYEYSGFSTNGLRSYVDNSSGEGLWGYLDIKGNVVIQPQFRFAGDFAGNGLARVIDRRHKSGFIDAKGTFAISPDFDCAYDFAPDGLARAMRHGEWGFIDATGKMIIRSRYFPVADFSRSGYAQVSNVKRYPVDGQCWGPYNRSEEALRQNVVQIDHSLLWGG
jgi:hypothetical protein